MRTGRSTWEQREALRTGKTVQQVLDDLMREGGGKWEVMGVIAGMTHQAVICMYKRNGITKVPCKHVTFRGVTTSTAQHCRTYGLSISTVKQYSYRKNMPIPEVLEMFLSGKVHRHMAGAKKSCQTL